MEPIYQRLEEVRERPGIYLGEISITRLYAYVSGYLTKEFELNPGRESSFDGFNDFICRKYDIPNRNWSSILLFCGGSEKGGIDRFYRDLDEYKASIDL